MSTVTATVRSPGEPEGVAVNPLTGAVYVANFDSGTVTVIRGYGRANTGR
jgi:DNA-binding beta-propeller fold protein YncE